MKQSMKEKYVIKINELADAYFQSSLDKIMAKYSTLTDKHNRLNRTNLANRRAEIENAKNNSRLVAFKILINNFQSKFDVLYIPGEESEHESFLYDQEFAFYSALLEISENAKEKAFILQQYLKNARLTKRLSSTYEEDFKQNCLTDDTILTDGVSAKSLHFVKIHGIGGAVYSSNYHDRRRPEWSKVYEHNSYKLLKTNKELYQTKLHNHFLPYLSSAITPTDAPYIKEVITSTIQETFPPKVRMNHQVSEAIKITPYDSFDDFFTQTCIVPCCIGMMTEIEQQPTNSSKNEGDKQ